MPHDEWELTLVIESRVLVNVSGNPGRVSGGMGSLRHRFEQANVDMHEARGVIVDSRSGAEPWRILFLGGVKEGSSLHGAFKKDLDVGIHAVALKQRHPCGLAGRQVLRPAIRDGMRAPVRRKRG